MDRNGEPITNISLPEPSLSARRAWIEISVKDLNAHLYYVALRKESVDRNTALLIQPTRKPGRSPQGERG